MDWKDIGKSLLSQGIPILGGLLGGPAGATAGKIVASLVDGNVDPDKPEEVMNAIQADSKSLEKIAQYEIEHKIKLQELQIEATRLHMNDLESARKREISVVQSTGKMDTHLYTLAYFVVACFIIVSVVLTIAMVAFPHDKNLPTDNPLLMLIIGALISGFTQVLSYFFGSSKGSAEKNAVFTAKG